MNEPCLDARDLAEEEEVCEPIRRLVQRAEPAIGVDGQTEPRLRPLECAADQQLRLVRRRSAPTSVQLLGVALAFQEQHTVAGARAHAREAIPDRATARPEPCEFGLQTLE